jgi:hypothetical protein
LRRSARRARSLEEEAATVHTTFNNNNRDYPVRNGLEFLVLLGQSPPDPEVLKAEYVSVERASSKTRRRG